MLCWFLLVAYQINVVGQCPQIESYDFNPARYEAWAAPRPAFQAARPDHTRASHGRSLPAVPAPVLSDLIPEIFRKSNAANMLPAPDIPAMFS